MKLPGNFGLGDAGGSTRRPVERGRNRVERNRQRAGAGRERSRGDPSASQGLRDPAAQSEEAPREPVRGMAACPGLRRRRIGASSQCETLH